MTSSRAVAGDSSAIMQKGLLTSITVGAFLVLLMPLVVADGTVFPDSFYPFIVPKAIYARSVIEVMFGLWLILAFWYPSYRLPRSWLLAIFGAHIVVSLLAALFGVSPQRSLWSTYERMQGVIDLAHWLAFTVIVTSVFRSLANWRVLLNLNLAVSLVIALLGVAQHYDKLLHYAQRFDFGLLDYLDATQRVNSSLGNPTYVGAFMMVNVLIAIGFLAQSFFLSEAVRVSAPEPPMRRRRRRHRHRRPQAQALDWSPYLPHLLRAFWITVIVIDLWVLTLTGTRGAIIGLSAGLFAFAIGYMFWGRVRPVRLVAIGVVGLLVAFGMVLIVVRETDAFDKLSSSNIMIRRVSDLGWEDESVKGRWNSIKVGLQGFADRPILGYGPENYSVAYDRHIPAETFGISSESFDQAHNKIIEELTTKGALGFLTYTSLWAVMFWVIVRKIRERGSPESMLSWFVFAAMTGYFVQNLFLFDTPATVLQFVLLMGFVINLSTTFQEEDEAPEAVRETTRADIDSETGQPSAGFAGLQRSWTSMWPGEAIARLGRSRALNSPAAPWVALSIVLVVLSLVLYYASYRPYHGAATVLNTTVPTITWQERFRLFDESIDSFNQLANYPRLVLFQQLKDNWHVLPLSDAQAALGIVKKEAEAALKAEPREWRIYVTLAYLYQRASSLDPSLLQQGRAHIETARELAPERVEVFQAMAIQQVAEGDLEGASNTIDQYLELSPESDFYFNEIKALIALRTPG